MEFAILTILITVLALIAAVNFLTREAAPVPRCTTGHQWVTDSTEKLVCMECGYRPEENQ
jgi:hypothetical protein